jgi:Zn-dependent peptidase ImmA (M78 family)
MAVLASLVQLVEQYVELPQPDIPDHLAGDLSVEAIEQTASDLRNLWGLGQGPISNMVALLEGRGCIVSRIIAGSGAVDAFSGRVGLRPFAILTVDKDNAERSRFDAAHELGHLVLHQDVNPGSQAAEKQAHAFASAFLMPRDVIAEELPSRLDFASYFELKVRWRVNVAALLYRARQVGRLSDPGFRRAMTDLNANGWRIHEPMSGPHEIPTVIAAALVLLERARGVGRDDLARELRVGREDIDQLLEDGPRQLLPPDMDAASALIAVTR